MLLNTYEVPIEVSMLGWWALHCLHEVGLNLSSFFLMCSYPPCVSFLESLDEVLSLARIDSAVEKFRVGVPQF